MPTPETLQAAYRDAQVKLAAGHLEEAAAAFATLAAQANGRSRAVALVSRVRALSGLARYDEALIDAFAAREADPGNVDALVAAGGLLIRLGRLTEAVETLRRVEGAGRADVHYNLGLALKQLGETTAALAQFDRALTIDPALRAARVQGATCRLALGDFHAGWRAYESRTGVEDRWLAALGVPTWSGAEPVAGKTILVAGEQGLGDTIQFARYLAPLRTLGARVLFAPQKPLLRLMRSLEGVVLVEPGATDIQADYAIRLMSLPLALEGRADAAPASVPYLAAEPDKTADWRARLGPEGFKIGVCWNGSTLSQASGRAFPVEQLRALHRPGRTRLISLQKAEAGVATPPWIETPGAGFDDAPFVDSAALASLCDLVISCDTSVAHLAGALGRPTWIPLNRPSCWRWSGDRADTAWYPNVRLFRQATRGDWSSVFTEIDRALAGLIAEKEMS